MLPQAQNETPEEAWLRIKARNERRYGQNAPNRAANGPTIDAPDEGATEALPEPVQPLKTIPAHLNKVGRSIPEAAVDAFKNAPESAIKLAKGVYDLGLGLASVPGTLYYKAAGIPDVVDPKTGVKTPNRDVTERIQKFDYITQNPGKIAGHIADYYKDYYGNLTDSFAEDPFQFILDASSVVSLGAGALGLGAKGAKAAGAVNAATKLGNAAKAVRGVGEYVKLADPTHWAMEAVKLAAKKTGVMDAMGFGKHSAPLMDRLQVTRAAGEIDAVADRMAAMGVEMTPQQVTDFQWRTFIGDEPSRKLIEGNPNLKAFAEELIPQQEAYMTVHGLLTPKKALRAKAIGAREYLKHLAGDDLERLAEVPSYKDILRKIKTGEWQPTFASLFSTDEFARTLIDRVHDTAGEGKFWSRAEKRIGGGNYSFDPKVFVPRMMESFNNLKQKKSFLDSALQYFIRHAPEDLKFLDAGDQGAQAALIKAGYREFPKALFEKYLDDTMKAHSALIQIASKGAIGADDIQRAQSAFGSFIDKNGRFNPPARKLYIPAHAAAMIAMEVGVPSTIRTMYRKGVGAVKTAQTILNPRFYGANLIGNSAILGLYGATHSDLRRMWKLFDRMPDQIRALIDTSVGHGRGPIGRIVDSLGTAAARIDNMAKGTVYAAEVKHKLMPIASQFFDSIPKLEEAISFFAKAPRDFVEAELAIHRQYMKAARNIPGLRELYSLKDKMSASLAKGTLATAPGVKGSFAQLEKRMASQSGVSKMLRTDVVPSVGPAAMMQNAATQGVKASDQAIQDAIIAYQRYNQNWVSGLDVIKRHLATTVDAVGSERQMWLQMKGAMGKRIGELQAELVAAAKLDPRAKYLAAQNAFMGIKNLIQDAEASIKHDIVQAMGLERIDPRLAKAARVSQDAINLSNSLFGAMGGLSPFEKHVLRDVLPYYTFTQAMTKLAFKLPYMWPGRMLLISNLAREWNEIMHDRKVIGSDQLKGYVPIMYTPDGHVIAARFESFNPWGGLRGAPLGSDGVGLLSTYDPRSGHPLIRVAIDMAYGPQIKLSAVQPDTDAISLSDGSQWNIGGKQFKRQKGNIPLAKHLINAVPLLGIIDKVFTKYVQSDQGYSLDPQPLSGPGGKPRAEIGKAEKVLNIAVPATDINTRERRTMAAIKTQGILRKMKLDLKFADPERKAIIIDALQRYGRGDTSRILDY